MLPVLLATLFASPNVVLISVDTLRADHLGFYGHANATSPNLDRLAAQGLVFDDMVCEIPLTGPFVLFDDDVAVSAGDGGNAQRDSLAGRCADGGGAICFCWVSDGLRYE